MKNQPLLLKPRIPSRDCCSRGPVGRPIEIAKRARPAAGPWLQGHNLLFLLTLLCAATFGLPTIHAATITVMNTNDSGTGSLRQALADAANGDTIGFDPSVTGTINLTSGELLVNDSITISGPGANVLAVNGNAASRVFHIGSGKTVSISGLTTMNGFDGTGAAINNDHAMLIVSNCTISGNFAVLFGGGIYNNHGTITVNNSTLSGNGASSGNGGGIYNDGLSGSATATINNSTLSGNSAGDINHFGEGGGIYNDNATLIVNNSTLSGNSAVGVCGGIYNGASGPGIVMIGNTILNAGPAGANIFNASGTVTSLGYNLSSDDGGGYLTATGDQINTDPQLGPLQDNGGPTFTHLPSNDSPAVDAGDPALGMDQRGTGHPRVANNRIDVGAIEVQPTATPTPTPTATPGHHPHPSPRPH